MFTTNVNSNIHIKCTFSLGHKLNAWIIEVYRYFRRNVSQLVRRGSREIVAGCSLYYTALKNWNAQHRMEFMRVGFPRCPIEALAVLPLRWSCGTTQGSEFSVCLELTIFSSNIVSHRERMSNFAGMVIRNPAVVFRSEVIYGLEGLFNEELLRKIPTVFYTVTSNATFFLFRFRIPTNTPRRLGILSMTHLNTRSPKSTSPVKVYNP